MLKFLRGILETQFQAGMLCWVICYTGFLKLDLDDLVWTNFDFFYIYLFDFGFFVIFLNVLGFWFYYLLEVDFLVYLKEL
jgi:hypothetical protein